jgi:hypothetical protein
MRRRIDDAIKRHFSQSDIKKNFRGGSSSHNLRCGYLKGRRLTFETMEQRTLLSIGSGALIPRQTPVIPSADFSTSYGENVVITESVAGSGVTALTTYGSMDDLSSGRIGMTVQCSGPTPLVSTEDSVVDVLPQSAVMLSGVPTSTWTYGCSATSAGILFGYYDRNGYSGMYTGPDNGGVAPLTDLGQGDDPVHPIIWLLLNYRYPKWIRWTHNSRSCR